MGGVEGRLSRKKLKNWSIFNFWAGDGILMKFDIWNDIVFQSSYFKSWPELMTLGGVGGSVVPSTSFFLLKYKY